MSVKRWAGLLAGCMALSLFLTVQLSVLMGGRWFWADVLFYGWFLLALFVILQIVKRFVSALLEKIIQVPAFHVHRRWLKGGIYWLIMFLFVVPFFLAMTSIHRVRIGDRIDSGSALGLAFEDVTLQTKDQLSLKAWFVPALSDKAVVIAHGLGANKSNFMGTVDLWHQLGFNVLIFDFRGHGESGGHTVSFGYRERLDVLAARDFLFGPKRFRAENIWGYGVSFGGAAMVLAQAEAPLFHALVIDSSFASLDTMAEAIVKRQKIIPAFLQTWTKEAGLFFVRLDVGYDIRDFSPERLIRKCSGIPVLIIHSKKDPLIPWAQSQRLFDQAAKPKQLVLLDTEGHFGTPNDPRYMEILRDYVIKHHQY